jgi:glycosyltransferase involved in cell wall biosynthesis
MALNVLIIQRFHYNFREGFFDYLSSINFDFKLINATSSKGRVMVHDEVVNKSFIEKTRYFFIGENYVVFPFLFFKLIQMSPKIVVSEGGQNTINNLQVLLYCKLFRRKFIIWDLGKSYADFGNSIPRRVYMIFYKFILNQALSVYGYNSQSYKYFKSLGIEDSKNIILNNTIDTRKIGLLRKKQMSKIPLEFEAVKLRNYKFLIFVGTLLRSKNIETMADLLRKLGENYFLIIVGDGSQKYKDELKETFYGTNHFFVGYKKLEELLPYYNLASFSILPGLGGLSINQSMAFGVPVICSKADGAEEDLIIKDKTGYIYKDLDDAYNFIISKTSEDWKKMGQEAESYLFSNYSVETMMNKFVSYINNYMK